MRKTNVANTTTASSRTGITLKRQNAFFYRRIASAVFYPAHPLFMMNHLSVELWMLNSMPLLCPCMTSGQTAQPTFDDGEYTWRTLL
ncbi:hypothetical protein FXE34_11290 [Vibrio cholerae]|nr:hypothetical protein [Vibrio cholerae]TYA07118.1 hypothetical protein FXE34_11290 [Vibrio cholerae]